MSSEEELQKVLLIGEAIGEAEEPQRLVEGCPGCKCAQYQRPGAPLPKEIMFIMAISMLCNTLPVQILYPYLYFLVEDFHVKKQKIGTYAGILASSFLVGRIFTSIPWGMIGDKYGRKFVLFSSMLSMLVFNTWFGLTKSFAMAFTTRFLLGAFSGLLATLQAYAAEIVSEEHRPFSLSLLGSMWGVGLVVGPALGGYFSKPAESFDFFKNTIFDEYPYFLPPLVVSFLGAIITLLLFRLPETLHNHSKVEASDEEQHSGENKRSSLLRNYAFWSSNTLYCLWAFQDMVYNEVSKKRLPASFGFTMINPLQTFSLWAVSPGGLQYSSQDVGSILAVNGVILLGFSIFIYPWLARRFTPVAIARAGAVLLLPVLAAHPCVEVLHGAGSYAAVTTISVLRVCFSAVPAASLFLIINNSVTQAQRGTANGINTCMVSVARALGPTIGGSIFSMAQSRPKASFLPGNQLLFFFMALFTVITLLATLEPILPRSAYKPKFSTLK